MYKYLRISVLLSLLITSAFATDIRIWNLRARSAPAPTATQNDYETFLNDINSAKSGLGSNSNPAYDFIGIEAYNMNKPGINPEQSTMLKGALANVYNNEAPTYTIIGRPRDNNLGDSEASVIAYNNKKWELIEDPAVNNQIKTNALSIAVPNGTKVNQSIYATNDNETGDAPVDSAHTIQLATTGTAVYPNDMCCGSPSPYSRIATWGVFQNKLDNSQVIYIVTHFPLNGQDEKVGYDNLYAQNIYTTIINPLRKAYPNAPVIFSADFNNGMANNFAKLNQLTLPYFNSQTFGEDSLGVGGDNMLKINLLASYSGIKFNVNMQNSFMVPVPSVALDKIMAHHAVVPDIMLSY